MDAKVRRSLNELSATEIADEIAAGKTTCEAVVRDCVARIAERDDVVKAFVNFDADLALAQARALDRGPRRGPLHGVPIGLKDTIDTFDMPTEMGSPIYRGNRPRADASCVALLRRAGAVILGKTATCEFAGSAPPETTNPHNPAHTPGGSSSGSAAAVADYMVPAALGTQTGGSVLRPSSFCGVFGYKPTYNTINKQRRLAGSGLDRHHRLAGALDRRHRASDVGAAHAGAAAAAQVGQRAADRRLAHGFVGHRAGRDQSRRRRRRRQARQSRRPGARRRNAGRIHRPARHRPLHDRILRARRMHGLCLGHRREKLSPQMRRYIENGHKISRDEYVAGMRRLDECRALLPAVLANFDVLLVPCVPGEAPKGLGATGDPSMQAIWTALHTPSMTLPTHRGPNNLPVGIQLVAQRYDDDRLFACARWIWEKIGTPDMVGVRRS